MHRGTHTVNSPAGGGQQLRQLRRHRPPPARAATAPPPATVLCLPECPALLRPAPPDYAGPKCFRNTMFSVSLRFSITMPLPAASALTKNSSWVIWP